VIDGRVCAAYWNRSGVRIRGVELVAAQDNYRDLLRLSGSGGIVAVDAGVATGRGCGCGSGCGGVVGLDGGCDTTGYNARRSCWRTSDELAHLTALAMPVADEVEIVHYARRGTLVKRLRTLRSADSVLVVAAQELSEPFDSLGDGFLVVALDCDDGTTSCRC